MCVVLTMCSSSNLQFGLARITRGMRAITVRKRQLRRCYTVTGQNEYQLAPLTILGLLHPDFVCQSPTFHFVEGLGQFGFNVFLSIPCRVSFLCTSSP